MHYRKPYFLFIFEYDSKKGQGNNADLCRIYEREERLYGKNTRLTKFPASLTKFKHTV